jgi:hypothetical protein
MNNLISFIFYSIFAIAGTTSAFAAVVNESEPNNTLATAQNVDGNFSTSVNADIENTGVTGWEWASVLGTGDGTFDYFSFSVLTGQSYVFDIDNGASSPGFMDAFINLYNGTGTLVSQVDDCTYSQDGFDNCDTDSGSLSNLDPTLLWTFASAGTYSVSVLECCSSAPQAGSSYSLQLSRDLSAVPVPAAVWLFGTALIGFVGMSRRRNVA